MQLMRHASEGLEILRLFTRHDRKYCLFSLKNHPDEFLYFSHVGRDLRALFFGKGFLRAIPEIEKKPDLCIECCLGTRIKGGVSLDGKDLINFHFPVPVANGILVRLRQKLGKNGVWIILF
jgi:hypothetical protein